MKTITLTVSLALAAGIFCFSKNPMPLTNEVCTEIANTTGSTTVEDVKSFARLLRSEDGLKKLSKLTNNRWSVDALKQTRAVLLANGSIELGDATIPVVISEARTVNALTAITRYYITTGRLKADELKKSAEYIAKDAEFSAQEFIGFIDEQVAFVTSTNFLTGEPIASVGSN